MNAGYQNSDLVVIGYSAGADAAMIFADLYMKNGGTGHIKAVILLGSTMTGSYLSGLGNEWRRIMQDLVDNGTYIYVFNDATDTDGLQGFSSSPQYTYVGSSQCHHEDPPSQNCTNNSPTVRAQVDAWLSGIP